MDKPAERDSCWKPGSSVGHEMPMRGSLLDFIRFGRLGDLQLGVARDEIAKRLGLPENWSGKPPVIGPIVLTPGEADVWFYYNDAAGIQFDDRKVSISVCLNPSEIDRSQHPFLGWPFEGDVRMSDFRDWLVENGVPFLVRTLEDEVYLLIGELCLVTCFPFEKGRLVPMHQRKISLIWTVVGVECLPDFVRSGVSS